MKMQSKAVRDYSYFRPIMLLFASLCCFKLALSITGTVSFATLSVDAGVQQIALCILGIWAVSRGVYFFVDVLKRQWKDIVNVDNIDNMR